MEKKLAMCIPTYNRPEVVKEFIEITAPIYIQQGIDIYIYDSSEGKETELIVYKFSSQCKGLYYVKTDSRQHPNLKVYNIFREFGGSLMYEYLWICSDSLRWSQSVLESINNYMEREYDIIIPNYRDVEKIGIREYVDKDSLFLDCAWHMTLFGATILKTSSMLEGVDWEKLVIKYMVPECINHSHVAFYFDKLSKMENNWKAIHFPVFKEDLMDSCLKKTAGWRKNTFYVWCHCWPTMINKLPECYNKNKEKVIKKHGINSNILSYSSLKDLRKEKILDILLFIYYFREWKKLTDVCPIKIFFLSLVNPIILNMWEKHKEWILKYKIKRFCMNYRKVYIYGAGNIAVKYTKYLTNMNIEFIAFLVSESTNVSRILENHKVSSFKKDILNDKNTGILLALNYDNSKEVLETTLKEVEKNKVFSEFKIM